MDGGGVSDMGKQANMTTRAPSHSNPRYVVVRVRKLLAAKGWPLHIVHGRYEAFGGGSQAAAEGFSVTKVGCSKWVSIHYCGRHANGRSHELPPGFARTRKTEAIEYLRSLGYRVDERGWIECEGYDETDR